MIQKTRNIGIMAHIDAGKTTTTERILYYTGKSHRIGEVDDGAATMDWMEQEQNRGITITSAATTTTWRDHKINIIDTPGARRLHRRGGSGACESSTGRLRSSAPWEGSNRSQRRCGDRPTPTPCRGSRSSTRWIESELISSPFLRRFGRNWPPIPVALSIPIGRESDFEGVIDLLAMEERRWHEDDNGRSFEMVPIRDSLRDLAEEWRERLLDEVSAHSDEITELMLEDAEVPADLIRTVLREQTLAGTALPVHVGASLRNIGVQPLLDAVI
jgi:elongation factor G